MAQSENIKLPVDVCGSRTSLFKLPNNEDNNREAVRFCRT